MTFQKSMIAFLLVVTSPLAQAAFIQKANWVSQLPRADIVRMMGAPAPTESLEYSGYEATSNLPASIDWRNKDGVNYLGKVMNQGNCGSCVAFASVATLEAQYSISSGMPGMKPSFSPQMLFNCGGGSCDRGWIPDRAAVYLKRTGVVDEACMPYTSGSTGDDMSCSNRCADASTRIYKIVDYNQPTGSIIPHKSIEAVKAALQKGPLLTTLTVYEDFLTYSSGVYLHKNGSSVGGHAVSIVGYDDSKQAWLVRNSWGEEYGEKGFVWVSYADQSGIGSKTWAFELAPTNGMVAVTSPTDREFVSGKQALTVAGDTNAEFFLSGGTSGKSLNVDCADGSVLNGEKLCSTSIDTASLPEGRYEIYAQSKTSKIKSQVREFFVLNSVPKMEISFTAAPGVDLSKPVKDRPEFLVKTKTSSVPLQYVEFRVMDSNGKIVSVKGNEYVLDSMKMGWRSNTVPNGNYTILFHGQITFKGKVYGVDSAPVKITVKN